MLKEQGENEADTSVDIDKTFDVREPPRPQGEDASEMADYFYFAETKGLVLFPAGPSPLNLPDIDFYFGRETPLEFDYLKDGQSLNGQNFINEIMQPAVRLLNWNGRKGEKLNRNYFDLFANSQKAAYISCHGNSFNTGHEKFWGLFALDRIYDADRIISAAIRKDYDLIILTACNPEGLPLAVEGENLKRPTILRFNVTNQLEIPKHLKPIVIVPPQAS